MGKVYQEEGSTFSGDGKTHDLNYIFRAVANDPIHQIEVSELIWVLEYDQTERDAQRDDAADLSFPILVTRYKGMELAIDGCHRLRKAVKLGVKTLPYRRVSSDLMRKSMIVSTALESVTLGQLRAKRKSTKRSESPLWNKW